DAELINKDIPHFLGMYMLFGRGVYPGWRKRRNRRIGIADGRGEAVEGSVVRGTERRSTSRAASSSSRGSNVIAGDNDNDDDDDDDFIPMAPRPGVRGIGRRKSTSRVGSSSSRGPNVIPGDNNNDDDDNFMPMGTHRPRPRSA